MKKLNRRGFLGSILAVLAAPAAIAGEKASEKWLKLLNRAAEEPGLTKPFTTDRGVVGIVEDEFMEMNEDGDLVNKEPYPAGGWTMPILQEHMDLHWRQKLLELYPSTPSPLLEAIKKYQEDPHLQNLKDPPFVYCPDTIGPEDLYPSNHIRVTTWEDEREDHESYWEKLPSRPPEYGELRTGHLIRNIKTKELFLIESVSNHAIMGKRLSDRESQKWLVAKEGAKLNDYEWVGNTNDKST